MRRTTRGLVGAAFAAGLALTGCGDGDTEVEEPEVGVPGDPGETPDSPLDPTPSTRIEELDPTGTG